jgi:hypothetical protein
MLTTSIRRPPLLTRLRAVFDAQVRLWDSAQRSLEPWRAEGPLRWSGGQLDGAELPSESPSLVP